MAIRIMMWRPLSIKAPGVSIMLPKNSMAKNMYFGERVSMVPA